MLKGRHTPDFAQQKVPEAEGRGLPGLAALAAAAAAATAIYAGLIERARVELVSYTLPLAKTGLPEDGLTILHLSDLHLRAAGFVQDRKLARLRSLTAGLRYDLLAVTGDLIHDLGGFAPALELLTELADGRPAFWVPGNHDYCESSVWGIFESAWNQAGVNVSGRSRRLPARLALTGMDIWRFARKVLRNERMHQPVKWNDVDAMRHALQGRGIEALINRAVHLRVRGADLWIAGVDDLMEGQPDAAAALANVPLGPAQTPLVPVVLLAHNPDSWLDPLCNCVDLTLSGHTHGGQVCLPMLGAVHTQGTHLKRTQAAGWFRRGRAAMFVSRGAGESLPLRFGARPQVGLIKLIPIHNVPIVKHLTI